MGKPHLWAKRLSWKLQVGRGERHYAFSILRILQFSLDSIQEGLHLKGLLKRAVGA